MKKSKAIFIMLVVLYIILCAIGALVYIYYIPKLTIANFSFASNTINISFSLPENFHAHYSLENPLENCIYTGLYAKSLMSLYIEKCEYNLEGYTLQQYMNEFEKYKEASTKRVNQEYIEISQNYTIIKSEYASLDDSQIPNCIFYTVFHNNIFYTFKTDAISIEMFEKYKSTVDTIMKRIQIDDTSFTFPYELNTNNKEEDIPYYYSLLSNEDKKIYKEILQVFQTYQTIEDGVKYTVTGFNSIFEKYANILYAITEDNVEYSNVIFYSFDYNNLTKEFSVYLDYDDMDNNRNYKKLMTSINKVVDNIINNMPANLTKYGKYKYLAESICDLVEYDDNPDEYLVYGIDDAFLNGKAKCTRICKRLPIFM